jgi:tetratricopeptide (TPR) repeat protein
VGEKNHIRDNPRDGASESLLVGREREMAELHSGLDSAISGRGRLFLISGEPGIGKSRLAEEVSTKAAQRGMRALWGRCWEGGGAPAYWPIIQVLRGCSEHPDFARRVESLGDGVASLAALIPEVLRPAHSLKEHKPAEPTDPQQGRFRLFDSVATLLKSLAVNEPLLLVIDDLHDSDAGTLQMLRFLAREFKIAPILLIGAYREAEVEGSPELLSEIAELAREATHLPLTGLSQAEARDLIRARAGITPQPAILATLHHATKGNPLFLGGVLQTLLAEGGLRDQEQLSSEDLRLPANLRAAVQARLKRMSQKTLSVVSMAAMIGNEFGLELLEELARSPIDELLQCLDEAAKWGVVSRVADARGRYRFTHALIRNAVCDPIGSSEQARLHLRIAEAIERRYAGALDTHVDELAHHYLNANPSGNAEKAIEYAIRAGRAAYTVFAYAKARENWEAALTLLDRAVSDASPQRASVLSCLGDALITQGPKAIEYLEASLREYERLGDQPHALELHIRLGASYASPNFVMDVPQSLAHLRKAEALAKEDSSGVALAYVFATRAWAYLFCNAVDEGIAAFQRAIEAGERAGVEQSCVLSTFGLGWLLFRRGCLRQGLEMLDLVRRKTDPNEEVLGSQVATGGADAYLILGDPAEAGTWLKRELMRTRTSRSPFRSAILRRIMSQVCFEGGDLAAGREHLENSTAEVSPVGTWPLDLYRPLFEGDWDAARDMATATVDRWATMGAIGIAIDTGLLLARVTRIQGNYGLAKSSAEQILRWTRENGDVARELRATAEAVLIFAAAGPIESAISHLERCREILGGGEDWRGLAGHVARAEAVVAAAEHRLSHATAWFERATTIYRHYTLPWEEAETLLLWGRASLDAGETSSADRKFDSALEIYGRVGAGQAWIDRARAEKARATDAHRTPVSAAENVFRREGDFWTIAYGGTTFRSKHSKGLAYLATLLCNPNREFHALELVIDPASYRARPSDREQEIAAHGRFDESGMHVNGPGDAGPMLDREAREAYARRLAELRETIEDARETNNDERIAEAEDEIEQLSRELSHSVGLGGRARVASSPVERARLSVWHAIKSALEKIAVGNPDLGRLLSTTIKTGSVCVYRPDPRFPIVWQF